MWRTAPGFLSAIRAVDAEYTVRGQRHAESAARPVPVDRYDALLSKADGVEAADIAALLWRRAVPRFTYSTSRDIEY
jgi:hypothetical protein